ncbi:DUF3467 domain-containing protein [uncultured Oxalicibacterium sp.]|uniref:DUF3467 domain-containing protein n=1 Tax=uncultured Oxalicibacterium sp. TaxID=1168540 RepID=UPI0025EE103F|nr:DUF3467 domain-containing protein [uncultured Oxalicibacterium sp.]
MAKTEKRSTETAVVEETKRAGPEPVSVPIKPRWDDSAMQSAYANVCNVMGTREEITLLFGTNKAWQAGSNEVPVELSHRITLTPYTAKRLAQMLEQGVREYEQRFGEIKLT